MLTLRGELHEGSVSGKFTVTIVVKFQVRRLPSLINNVFSGIHGLLNILLVFVCGNIYNQLTWLLCRRFYVRRTKYVLGNDVFLQYESNLWRRRFWL